MRKILSIALCAAVLAGAGVSQASVDAAALKTKADPVQVRLQQFTSWLQAPGDTLRAGSLRSTPRQTAEQETNQLMLLASLVIMGMIIRRRWGSE